MPIQENLYIPIHASKASETILKFMDFKCFKKSFQHAYECGSVWGVYLSKKGNIAYQNNNGRSYYKILKSK